jgi:hypothetical protein
MVISPVLGTSSRSVHRTGGEPAAGPVVAADHPIVRGPRPAK